LAKPNEILNQEPAGNEAKEDTGRDLVGSGKKLFVEPEISAPVDVLEATTFFQVVDRGATN
jgi:hypothetical protein